MDKLKNPFVRGHKIIDAEKLNNFLKSWFWDSFQRNFLAYEIAEHEDEVLKTIPDGYVKKSEVKIITKSDKLCSKCKKPMDRIEERGTIVLRCLCEYVKKSEVELDSKEIEEFINGTFGGSDDKLLVQYGSSVSNLAVALSKAKDIIK